MKKASLKQLNAARWPFSSLTYKIRDEYDNLKAKDIKQPFVYLDLRQKPLASWAAASETARSSGTGIVIIVCVKVWIFTLVCR